jgi:hypothetical protein
MAYWEVGGNLKSFHGGDCVVSGRGAEVRVEPLGKMLVDCGGSYSEYSHRLCGEY